MNGANEKEEKLTLDLLNAIDQRSDLSQRHLARQMGIALGLTNSYLKRCARKGLVKVSEAPANRYLYYLTPKGFAEKARLTGHYLANGVSELSEIALIRAMDAKISITGIYDPESSLDQLFSKPVWADLAEAKTFDMCLLTDLNSPYEFYESLVSEVG